MTLHSAGVEAGRLKQRIGEFEQECILRVRRGRQCWESSSPSPALRTASVTKTFTAAVVMQLWEEGVLALDDTLARYVPAALCDRLHHFEGRSWGRGITIRQLLCHRSGLVDYATDAGFMAEVAASPQRRWSPHDLLDAALRAGPPGFEPGAGVAYSDTGYVLLGLVIEAATGAPLATAYRQRLLGPLGLHHTWLEGKEPGAGIAVARAWAGAVDTSGFDPSFDAFGGGGLVATAADLDRYITALMTGAVFRHAATLQTMMAGTEAPPGVGTRKTRTACGLSEFSIAGQRFWGHLGHWNSYMLYCADADLALCGSFNQSATDPRQSALLEAAVAQAMRWR
jgi:D-alanyl-D-alanine carboxypeptidase